MKRKDIKDNLIETIKGGNYHDFKKIFNMYESFIDIFLLIELISLQALIINKNIYQLVSRKALEMIDRLLDGKPIKILVIASEWSTGPENLDGFIIRNKKNYLSEDTKNHPPGVGGGFKFLINRLRINFYLHVVDFVIPIYLW